MSKDLKLTNTIATKITAIDEDDPVAIFPAGDEARILKILVVNKQEVDMLVQLSSFINPDTGIIGTFRIPASAGSNASVPAVDLVPLLMIASKDNAENFFFNLSAVEELRLAILEVPECNISVIVKAELYD